MQNKTVDKKRLELIAVLRLFLWWGTQSLKQVLHVLDNQAQIRHVTKTLRIYPDSRWAFIDKKVYCLTAYSDEKRVTVYQLSDMSMN